MGILSVSLSKAETLTLLNISEYALLLFALVVVIGVTGEHKTPWWKVRYDLFAILVAIGCAGELVADGGVFVFSRHLQVIEGTEVANLNHNSIELRLQADTARLEQERLKSENLKLEALIQPRSLSIQQQGDIGLALMAFKGYKVTITYLPSDPEEYNFARQLRAALRFGKVDAELWNPGLGIVIVPQPPHPGVKITWNSNNEELATRLKQVLGDVGRVREIWLVRGSPAATEPLVVSVYAKPFEVLEETQVKSNAETNPTVR